MPVTAVTAALKALRVLHVYDGWVFGSDVASA
jgi:hypothetical protein